MQSNSLEGSFFMMEQLIKNYNKLHWLERCYILKIFGKLAWLLKKDLYFKEKEIDICFIYIYKAYIM